MSFSGSYLASPAYSMTGPVLTSPWKRSKQNLAWPATLIKCSVMLELQVQLLQKSSAKSEEVSCQNCYSRRPRGIFWRNPRSLGHILNGPRSIFAYWKSLDLSLRTAPLQTSKEQHHRGTTASFISASSKLNNHSFEIDVPPGCILGTMCSSIPRRAKISVGSGSEATGLSYMATRSKSKRCGSIGMTKSNSENSKYKILILTLQPGCHWIGADAKLWLKFSFGLRWAPLLTWVEHQ